MLSVTPMYILVSEFAKVEKNMQLSERNIQI